MNKNMILILLFQISVTSVFSQPGGGGGIKIMNIMDYYGKPFVKGDSNLQILHYALSDNEKKQKFLIQAGQEKFHRFYDEMNTFYYLPPHIWKKNKIESISNQRILLIYMKDTMTIDFIDVLGENGAGHSDVIDKIYFKSGYYKSYRNPGNRIDSFGEKRERKEIINAMRNGINTNTDHVLLYRGLLKHIPDPNLHVKQLTRQRLSCSSEFVISPYWRLCEKQIKIQDSAINLTIEPITGISDDSAIVQCVYYFSFDVRNTDQNSEVRLAATMLQSFEKFGLMINDVDYTGVLKLAVPFHNAGISTRFSGYDLWILEYSDGKLIGKKLKHDVEIISEQSVERPN